ncbi:two-component system, LytTR family, sensor histidine kinase AgrC [Enterococcus sp. DIV0724b]|uniref:hypothetical protein n=1 Tax=Enterococcus sp. DIV0724b TaxID=2774694 RepID=UPI003D2FE0B7
MEFIIFIRVIALNYCLLIYFLNYKRFTSKKQTVILLFLACLQIMLSLITKSPYISIILFSLCIMQPIMIARFLNNWLPVALLLYLQSFLVILSWLVTYDLFTFLYQSDLFSPLIYEQYKPIVLLLQHLILFLLIKSAIKVDHYYHIFDSIFQIQKNYKLLSILLTALFVFLSVLRQTVVIKIANVSFYYLTIILLILSLIFCFSAFLYSRYYQKLLQKQVLAQQYKHQMKKMQLSDEFRHDYQNILLSLVGYIENGERDEALDYINSIENYSTDILEDAHYSQLNQLEIPAIQGLLTQQINLAQKKNIQLHLCIPTLIKEVDILIRLIDLIFCLSKLLSFAITQADIYKQKTLYLSIKKCNSHIIFALTNSVDPFVTSNINMTQSYSTFNTLQNANLKDVQKTLRRYKGTSFSLNSHSHYFLITFDIRTISN